MSDRYFSKVVSILDEYTVVINKGLENDIKKGDEFLIIGLGEVINDPDTGEKIEQLEVVRGKACAKHVQNKITTLESCEYFNSKDIREITKISKRPSTLTSNIYANFHGTQDSVTEIFKPGEALMKPLEDIQSGDFVIRL